MLQLEGIKYHPSPSEKRSIAGVLFGTNVLLLNFPSKDPDWPQENPRKEQGSPIRVACSQLASDSFLGFAVLSQGLSCQLALGDMPRSSVHAHYWLLP